MVDVASGAKGGIEGVGNGTGVLEDASPELGGEQRCHGQRLEQRRERESWAGDLEIDRVG